MNDATVMPNTESPFFAVSDSAPTVHAFPGSPPRLALRELAGRALRNQWNANDLPWSIDVDYDQVSQPRRSAGSREVSRFFALRREMSRANLSPSRWKGPEWSSFLRESFRWSLSQALHGEQGALLASAKLVRTLPNLDGKNFAATQVADEARHVEVLSRYLTEKLECDPLPTNPHLQDLLTTVIDCSEWDITYLGMQVIVEGLALAGFRSLRAGTTEPLLDALLQRVLADEARHVAFGVIALRDRYADATSAELRDRKEFALQAVHLVMQRLRQEEAWIALGVPRYELPLVVRTTAAFRAALEVDMLEVVIANCERIGLLVGEGDWLRVELVQLREAALERAG